MKILLIWPYGAFDGATLPLCYLYLIPILKKKHEVKFIDCALHEIHPNSEKFSKIISDFQPDVVGVSAWTVHKDMARSTLKKVKTLNSKIITIAGGPHFTGSANYSISNDVGIIDYVLKGEAELTYVSGSLTMNHDSGAAIINLDGSTGQSQVKLRNAGTTKWEVGIDGDGAGNQKSHVDDFAFYNDSYGVVISGNGSNKFGIGTQAGIALSGKEIQDAGIQFPATETLSTSPNNMDVYEEGTWTPVIQFGNTASSFTYGTQTGYYTRIGRMILIHGRLDVTGGSTGSTGNAKISGLPWQSNVTPASHSAASIGYMAGFSFANQATLMIQSGSTYLDYMETTESGTVSHLTHSNFTTSHQLFFSGLYFDV